jgi:Flp pilus assembly protein TadB
LTPPLRESNPLTASDTQVTIPVVVAVIGPVWTTVIIVAALALIVGVVVGIVWLVRRRRRKRAVEALGT